MLASIEVLVGALPVRDERRVFMTVYLFIMSS